jgi:hypothetical protein
LCFERRRESRISGKNATCNKKVEVVRERRRLGVLRAVEVKGRATATGGQWKEYSLELFYKIGDALSRSRDKITQVENVFPMKAISGRIPRIRCATKIPRNFN